MRSVDYGDVEPVYLPTIRTEEKHIGLTERCPNNVDPSLCLHDDSRDTFIC